jgi:hypothetical protein
MVLPSGMLGVPCKVLNAGICSVPIFEVYVARVGTVVPNPNKSVYGIYAVVDSPLLAVDSIGNTLCG